MEERLFSYPGYNKGRVKNEKSNVVEKKAMNNLPKQNVNGSVSNFTRKEIPIYSPNLYRNNMPNPVIFPPPKVIDRVVNNVGNVDYEVSNNNGKQRLDHKQEQEDRSSKRNKKPLKCKKLRRGYRSLIDLYSIQLSSPENSKNITQSLSNCKHTQRALDTDKINTSANTNDLENISELTAIDELINSPDNPTVKENADLETTLNIVLEENCGEELPSLEDNFNDSNEQSKTLVEKISEMLEESTEKGEEAGGIVGEDEVADFNWEKSYENNGTIDRLSNKNEELPGKIDNEGDVENLGSEAPVILVKLPVLLASIDVEIDIIHSMDLLYPIENQFNLDWSIESVKTHVVLPSNRLFIKGVLIARLEYANEETKLLHTERIPIEWERVVRVDWLTDPEQSKENKKEFTFHSGGQYSGSHYEYLQTFQEPIEKSIQGIHFVWHHDLTPMSTTNQVGIQGTAKLTIDLLQKQYIRICV